jgi:hypothetical protein
VNELQKDCGLQRGCCEHDFSWSLTEFVAYPFCEPGHDGREKNWPRTTPRQNGCSPGKRTEEAYRTTRRRQLSSTTKEWNVEKLPWAQSCRLRRHRDKSDHHTFLIRPRRPAVQGYTVQVSQGMTAERRTSHGLLHGRTAARPARAWKRHTVQPGTGSCRRRRRNGMWENYLGPSPVVSDAITTGRITTHSPFVGDDRLYKAVQYKVSPVLLCRPLDLSTISIRRRRRADALLLPADPIFLPRSTFVYDETSITRFSAALPGSSPGQSFPPILSARQNPSSLLILSPSSTTNSLPRLSPTQGSVG